jgi:carbon storage regulator
MLVLTRRMGERIMVGEDISIEVVMIEGGKVRIGIDAPRSMDVDREELRERKLEERRRAVELAR